MRYAIRPLVFALMGMSIATPALAQLFGSGAAVKSGEILIAEPSRTASGQIHVYQKMDGEWAASSTLVPYGVDGSLFGRWFAFDGDQILAASASAGHVFAKVDGTWQEVSALDPGELEEGTIFGTGAISEEVAVISAMRRGPRGSPPPPGQVYVFERGPDGWMNGTVYSSPDAAPGDGFGASIAIVDDEIYVGAPWGGGSRDEATGLVYVMRRGDDGTWSVEEQFAPPSARPGDLFGALIAADPSHEGRLYVTSAGLAGAGGVHVVETEEGGAPSFAGVLLPPSVSYASGRVFAGAFGSAITRVGDELWIGASGVGRGGSVMRYTTTDDGGFAFSGVFEGSANRARFGTEIAAEGGFAVISSPGKDYGMGTTTIFEQNGDGWMAVDEVWSESENYAAVNGHEVGCEEGVAADFDCSEVNILSFMPVASLGANRGTRVNDVWGWTDPETNREYALVGLTDQTSFVDITDPLNPRYVGRLPMTEGARGSSWRDIKVYDSHAFIVSDGAGEHGMQVFDLKHLRDTGSEPVTFEVDALYDEFDSSHNVVINEETGFAYSVGSSGGGSTCGGGLHMIDIKEPLNPVFAGCFAHAETGRRGTGYSHDALCLVYDGPDTDWTGREICFGSNENVLSIADVTDKDAPVAISKGEYPGVSYAHQGWVTEDLRYFYLGDELDELQTEYPGTRTMIFDIQDLDDPQLLREHFGESTASDHNMYVQGNLLYQSNYNSGLRILDLEDPVNPVEVGFIDTVPYEEGPSMNGSWSNYPYFASGTIVVTSGGEGLFMVKYQQRELVP